ncbi:MAG: nucleotide exchange factor GrpE [Elusimicrobia bacterium RIFCSPLOWO2_01_FULL_60_11]|nr:MAG: nucleotide exchange factor GrpE [Elusimicrobia bacterium RIFCSPLOWO2_01_FULL_60_11]
MEEAPVEESAEELAKKAEDYHDQIVRLQAEFSNFRKRAEKEKAEAIRFGREAMLERMIGLTDVMESALHHSKNATDVASLMQGFEMVLAEFSRFLKSEGVQEIKAKGEVFDPHLHEAVEQVETAQENENDIVLEEIQKGYTAGERVIRHAKVKVAKFKNKEENNKE